MSKAKISFSHSNSFYLKVGSVVTRLSYKKGEDGNYYPQPPEELTEKDQEFLYILVQEDLGLITTKERLIAQMKIEEDTKEAQEAVDLFNYNRLKKKFEGTDNA